MSLISKTEDPAAAAKGALPDDQQKNADNANLQVDTKATQAEAGSPQYGEFGNPNNVVAAGAPKHNDGSNDNPDEFSEFREPGRPTTEDYGTTADAANPAHQQGHIEQNQAPSEVKAAQHKETDEQRAAWSNDDERYAGGHREASWEDSNEKEHSND